jgi:Rps23 Pro-64 3,4-dihydroxylase Tpa1-like proline 4-hydroxylase
MCRATQLATMPKQSVNQLQHAIYVDAQATRYMPGHFLSTHDDAIEGKNRRAAYIFNFTPEWRPDWGGYLQLLDDAGHVRRGLVPSFSTLNILAVPQRHNVSVVAPFAGGMRFAISGWFRYGEKPAMSR